MMRRVVLAAVIGLSVTGCAAPAQTPAAKPMSAPIATPTTTTPTVAPASETIRSETKFGGISTANLPAHRTLVAMTVDDIDVYETKTSIEPTLTMPHTTILGTVTVFEVVEGPFDGWARVKLPVRPNGTEGWIKADDLMLYIVDSQVVIDLSDRTLTYFEDGEEILTTPVAVGSKRNPTPVGEFFITDNVTLANPGSAWGPHAFGLSARSETIMEYNGGDGIIGIHGTNRPGSIGNAASLGCVRVPNEVITELHELVPLGTPVSITA
jgi:lipoprotein-anchoring transpeptidase ErfK/SrfK